MEPPSETERRKSDALPHIGYSRYDRTAQEEQYSPHRQAHNGPAVITPTSPTAKYASPMSASATLPKQMHAEYISPPESRRTSEKEEEPRSVAPLRPVTLPSLPSLNQMIDTIPTNYIPASIVSTGSAVHSGPPSLGSNLSASSTPRHFSSRLPPPHDSDTSGSALSSSTLPRPPSSHHSPPHGIVTNPAAQEVVNSHSRAVTPQRSLMNNSSFTARESSESHQYGYRDRDIEMKGSPRSQPRSGEHMFTRPPPPPPTHYTHGYEHHNTPYESRPYGQISPHISAFPPPPAVPHSSSNTGVPSSSAGSQTFPGQAAALYAYQHRNGPYANDQQAPHAEAPFSPKGKSVSGKTSFQDTYGSAINRALDISELRRELDLIRDNASHLYHFSTQYTPQGGQPGGFQALKYSGQIEPSIQALDDAINITHRILEALEYWRNKVVNDQGRKHEQQLNSSKPVIKRPIDHVEDDSTYGDEMRGGLHSDSKKPRKGKAAPPGRCHSCNRAETPEWRRGPDGARTLCNACGLHYAKLTRKLNKGNPSLGPSPLVRKATSTTLM